MGNSTSKAARAAGSAARQYPTRPSNYPTPTSQPSESNAPPRSEAPQAGTIVGPSVHPQPQASSTRSEAIDLDARDPDFASRLSTLGPVKPYPTHSNSSTTHNMPTTSTNPSSAQVTGTGSYPSPAANPAVAILSARKRIQEDADQERVDAGRSGFAGKQFLDIASVRKVLALRDEQGMQAAEIERVLGLKKGVVARLGRVGVVEAA